MQLEVGKSYLIKTKKHAIDVLQIVQEPGRGTVALSAFYHIEDPKNQQMELYQVDGSYRLDRVPDDNWDVLEEYAKKKDGTLGSSFEGGLFDKDGQQIYPLVSAKALARIYGKGETIPVIQFSYSSVAIDGYVKLQVLPDAIVKELIK